MLRGTVSEKNRRKSDSSRISCESATAQPLSEGARAVIGDAVDPARAPAAGSILAGDPTDLLELPQLGVDLPVAGRPEVADRTADAALDVVTAPGLERSVQALPRSLPSAPYLVKIYQ